jgi:hypothetical protein
MWDGRACPTRRSCWPLQHSAQARFLSLVRSLLQLELSTSSLSIGNAFHHCFRRSFRNASLPHSLSCACVYSLYHDIKALTSDDEEVSLAYETATCLSAETSRTLCLLLKLLADNLFGHEASPAPLPKGLSLRDLYHYKSPALRASAHGTPSLFSFLLLGFRALIAS